jgi:nitrogenase molybdenum-iron protein alpha/beta subunit
MRTATNVSKKSAPKSLSKLSAKAKRPVKATAEAKAAPKAAAAVATEGKKVSVLKTLCAEVGINPKVARRELRRIRKAKEGMQWHSLKTRWILTAPQRAEVKKHLADYVERNGKSK